MHVRRVGFFLDQIVLRIVRHADCFTAEALGCQLDVGVTAIRIARQPLMSANEIPSNSFIYLLNLPNQILICRKNFSLFHLNIS